MSHAVGLGELPAARVSHACHWELGTPVLLGTDAGHGGEHFERLMLVN